MSLLVMAMALAAQSISGDGQNLQPASAAAIVAGGKACIGATVDPAGMDARLAGWSDATGAEKAGMKTEGRVVVRDNVMLVVKPGEGGGCVVQARAATGFDKARFLSALSAAVGTPVGSDPQMPVTNLPNGELMVVQIGDEDGATMIQLVVAGQDGKYAKHAQGK